MGLLKTIKNVFREKAEQADKALADPIRDGKFAIEDSKKQIAEMRRALAQFMATNKKMEGDQAAAKAEVAKWQNIAVAAAKDGNEDAARTALENKGRNKDAADKLKQDIERNNREIEKIKKQIDVATRKIADADSKHSQLAARKKAADVRAQLSAASSKFSTDGGALASLDDFENEVEAKENEIDAMEELDGGGDEDLVEQYGKGAGKVDDELAALMAKSG